MRSSAPGATAYRVQQKDDAMNARAASMLETLSLRERYRDDYRRKRDPICEDRLLWRAQSLRHLVHFMPGQAVLELGCGDGLFTRQLFRVSRGENPLTAVSFGSNRRRPEAIPKDVEFLAVSSLPGALLGRHFDFVVGMDLLDRDNSAELLKIVYDLLSPGGQVLFYESNPWNVVLKTRRAVARLFGAKDPRRLVSRPELYELISEIGFIRIWAVFTDFVYRPLTRSMAWVLRNLSILLENAPAVRTLAGSILVQAQKPPRNVPRPRVSLFEHEALRYSVSVVIPCHNEEMNIGPLVNGLRELFGEYLHEIIPVDDNSMDATRDVIERLAAEDPKVKPIVRTPPNGVGRALAEGYRAATGQWVLSMDCDFQHLLPEVRDLFDAAAEGYDVAVGSRFSRHSVLLNYPFQKIVANRGFHLLAQLVLWRRFRDLTNNLKLMRRGVAEGLQLRQPGFAVNAETGLQPLLMGCKIKEVPISWINRTPDMGTSSFRLVRVGGGYWHVLFDLWLKTVFGRGPYRDLARVGEHRETWRDRGLPPEGR
jgi:dolichol-phosphate mannosyltransferase